MENINRLITKLITTDRSRLEQPNGFILGTSRSGKSFVANDDIIICDPKSEYFRLANALHEQLIKSASLKPYVTGLLNLFNHRQNECRSMFEEMN